MAYLTVSDLCAIVAKEFDEDIVETFRMNKIDGETFLELSSEDLKELGIVALGDRKKLSKLTKRLSEMSVDQVHKILNERINVVHLHT